MQRIADTPHHLYLCLTRLRWRHHRVEQPSHRRPVTRSMASQHRVQPRRGSAWWGGQPLCAIGTPGIQDM